MTPSIEVVTLPRSAGTLGIIGFGSASRSSVAGAASGSSTSSTWSDCASRPLVARRARRPCSTCRPSASIAAPAGSGASSGMPMRLGAIGERGAERRLRVAVRVDDRRVQRLDLADLQAAEANRRAGLQAADRAFEEGVDHDAARRGRRRRSSAARRSRSGRGRRRGRGGPGAVSDPTVSKETPPCRSETRLSTLSWAPPAPISIEKPLAFQKRVPSVSAQVVGGVDEGVDRHVAGVGQLDVLDAADLDALEEHRRADAERAAGRRAQPDPQARLVGRGQGLAVEGLEALDAGARLGRPSRRRCRRPRARSRCR